MDKNRLQRLRDSVAANPLRAVARHHANDQGACHGNQHCEPTEMVTRRRRQCRAHRSEIEEVGKKADQTQQRPGHARSQQTDHDGKERNRNYARRRREVAQ